MTNTGNTVEDFINEIGKNVTYVPNHANGDREHKDSEQGIVSSVNEVRGIVFVKYIRNGILQQTAEGTDPSNLLKG
jgi:hypothetical protein